MRRNATLQSEATFKIAARRCREGEVQGRAVVRTCMAITRTERLSTRYAPEYFAMMRDFAREGGLTGVYGDAEITRPKGRAHGP
jgi:hypothetical protein